MAKKNEKKAKGIKAPSPKKTNVTKIKKEETKEAKEKKADLVKDYRRGSTDYIKTLVEDPDFTFIICGDKQQKYYILRLIRRRGATRNLISQRGEPLPSFEKSEKVLQLIDEHGAKERAKKD